MSTVDHEIDKAQALEAAKALSMSEASPVKFLEVFEATKQFHSEFFPSEVAKMVVSIALGHIKMIVAGNFPRHIEPMTTAFSYLDIIEHYLNLFREPRMSGREPISTMAMIGQNQHRASIDSLLADKLQPEGIYHGELHPQDMEAFIDILSIIELNCLRSLVKHNLPASVIWSVDRYAGGIVFVSSKRLDAFHSALSDDDGVSAFLFKKFFENPDYRGRAVSVVNDLSGHTLNDPMFIRRMTSERADYRHMIDENESGTKFMIEGALLKIRFYREAYALVMQVLQKQRSYESQLAKTMAHPTTAVVLHLP
ncbi:MAG: hypothetical protein WC775_02305 [Patescibacteria group bacterium]|jgi:hypothetical protein